MDPKFVVSLSGRDYPLYAGILAEAHERGLASIETQIIQMPAEENGHTAVTKAKVTMKDGSFFEGYGDANAKNVNPRMVTAILRMSETRAKGRALRDAINCGQTMLEELPDLEEERQGHRAAPARREEPRTPHQAARNGEGEATCVECGVPLTAGQVKVSMQRWKLNLCPAHQAALAKTTPPPAEEVAA